MKVTTTASLALVFNALLAFATPVQKRQSVDLSGLFDPLPDPVALVDADNLTQATNARHAYLASLQTPLSKRQCYGAPVYDRPSPDTLDVFSTWKPYQDLANNAATPSGTSKIFSGQTAASDYDAPFFSVFSTYDVAGCRDKCLSQDGCKAFNIYFQESNNGPAYCTNIYLWCDLLSYVPSNTPSTGTNGFSRIIGSNGYELVAGTVTPVFDGFQAGHSLDTCVVNAPLDANNNNINTYMGSRAYPDTDISRCAQLCKDTTAYNAKHPAPNGTYRSCNYFTAGQVYTGDKLEGVQCAMYTKDWSSIETTKKNCGNGGKTYKAAYSYLVNGYTEASRTELAHP